MTNTIIKIASLVSISLSLSACMSNGTQGNIYGLNQLTSKINTTSPQGELAQAEIDAQRFEMINQFDKKRVTKWENVYSLVKGLSTEDAEENISLGNGFFMLNKNPYKPGSKIDKIALKTANANASFGFFQRAKEIIKEQSYETKNGDIKLKKEFDINLINLLVRINYAENNVGELTETCNQLIPFVEEEVKKTQQDSTDFLNWNKSTKKAHTQILCADRLYHLGEKDFAIELFSSTRDFVVNELKDIQSSSGRANMESALGIFKSLLSDGEKVLNGMGKFTIHFNEEDKLYYEIYKKMLPIDSRSLYSNVLIANALTSTDQEEVLESLQLFEELRKVNSLSNPSTTIDLGGDKEMLSSTPNELNYQQLAAFYLSKQNLDLALYNFEKSLYASDTKLISWSTLVNEGALTSLLETRRQTINLLLSKLSKEPDNEKLMNLAFEATSKTQNIETNLNTFLASSIYKKGNIKDIRKYNDLMSIASELDNLKSSKNHDSDMSTYSDKLNAHFGLMQELKGKYKQEILGLFNKDVAYFKNNLNVSNFLGQDSLYINFVEYLNIPSNPLYPLMEQGEARYGVFVVTIDGMKFYDLDNTESINLSVSKYVKLIKSPINRSNKREFKQISKLIYNKILAPIFNDNVINKNIIISPAGELNALPFETLYTKNDKLLIAESLVRYVTSTRSLINKPNKVKNKKKAAIFAASDFGKISDNNLLNNQNLYSNNRSVNGFLPLPGIELEAEFVSNSLNKSNIKVDMFLGKQASETSLRKLKSPSVLHIASHGFSIQKNTKQVTDKSTNSWVEINQSPVSTGIALAGANANDAVESFKDDGIMYWHEFAAMDLSNTELVVLSACETAIGEQLNGQANSGLRRAIEIAGAQSSVSTLWAIPNTETIDLIIDFYDEVNPKTSRAEALRKAKLKLISERPDPYYWAGFILTESSFL